MSGKGSFNLLGLQNVTSWSMMPTNALSFMHKFALPVAKVDKMDVCKSPFVTGCANFKLDSFLSHEKSDKHHRALAKYMFTKDDKVLHKLVFL